MSKNPFSPATQITPRVKALFYGGPGVGKSRLAVDTAIKLAAAESKRAAAISMEAGLEYLPEMGFDFDILGTKSYADTLEAVDYLLSPEGQRQYGAVVIDPITVLYQIVQEAQQDIVERRAARKGQDPNEQSVGFREWGKVKQQMDKLATRLVNCQQHVLVTAREAVEYEQAGNNLKAVGYKAECHKSWPFLFDFVGRITVQGRSRVLSVVKDRFAKVGDVGASVSDPSAELFAWAAGSAGAWKRACDVVEAAAREADQEEEPLASAETIALIEEVLDQLASEAASTWWEGEKDKVALSQPSAERTLAKLQAKLTPPVAAVA